MATETALSEEDSKLLLDSLEYFRFDEPTDWESIVVKSYDIEPLSAEKRIRVFCGQFLYTIIEHVTTKNYLNKAGIYYLYGENLRTKYPEYNKMILQAYLMFWQALQMKLKELSKR